MPFRRTNVVGALIAALCIASSHDRNIGLPEARPPQRPRAAAIDYFVLRIDTLAGGGITPSNVVALVDRGGVRHVDGKDLRRTARGGAAARVRLT